MTIEPKPSPEDNYGFPSEYTVMFIARSNTYIVALGERSVRVPGAMMRVPGGKESAMIALSSEAVDLSPAKGVPPTRLKPGDAGFYEPGGLEPTGKKFVGGDVGNRAGLSVKPPESDTAKEVRDALARSAEQIKKQKEKDLLTTMGMRKPPRREVPGMADISTLVTKDRDPSRREKYLGPRGETLDRDQWQELFVAVTVLEEDFAHGYMIRTSWVPAYPSPVGANWESVCVPQTERDPLMTSDLMWRYTTYGEALKGHALLLREVIQHQGMEFDNYVPDEEL